MAHLTYSSKQCVPVSPSEAILIPALENDDDDDHDDHHLVHDWKPNLTIQSTSVYVYYLQLIKMHLAFNILERE